MSPSELQAAVRERDGVAVIDLVGEVNASAEEEHLRGGGDGGG